MRFFTTATALVALLLGTTCTNLVDAAIAPAEGCTTFISSVGGDAVIDAATLSGSLADGGYVFTLNNFIIDITLEETAIETSLLYTMVVIPAAGSPSTYTEGLIRVSSSSSVPDGISLDPGVNGQDATCAAPIVGISTTQAIKVKTELGADFITTSGGIITVDVTVINTDKEWYSTTYRFTANEVLPDFPTVTPDRVSASPASTFTSLAPTPVGGVPLPVTTAVDPADNSTDASVTLPPVNSTDAVDEEDDSVSLGGNDTEVPVLIDDTNSTSDEDGVASGDNTTATTVDGLDNITDVSNMTNPVLIDSDVNGTDISGGNSTDDSLNATDVNSTSILDDDSNSTDASGNMTDSGDFNSTDYNMTDANLTDANMTDSGNMTDTNATDMPNVTEAPNATMAPNATDMADNETNASATVSPTVPEAEESAATTTAPVAAPTAETNTARSGASVVQAYALVASVVSATTGLVVSFYC